MIDLSSLNVKKLFEILGVFILIGLIRIEGAHGSYSIIGPKLNYLELAEKARSINPETDFKKKERIFAFQESCIKEESGGEMRLKLQDELRNSLDCDDPEKVFAVPIWLLRRALKYYGQERFFSSNGASISPEEDPTGILRRREFEVYKYLIDEVKSTKRLSALREVFAEGTFTIEEWTMLSEIVEQANEAERRRLQELVSLHPRQRSEFTKFNSAEFYSGLEAAVHGVEAIAQEGDTIVAVGNTPQFVKVALEHSAKRFQLISIAISGWPGQVKSSQGYGLIDGLLTERGLSNFRAYMDRIGLSPRTHHQKIFLLDIVGEGQVIEFLVHQIRFLYGEENNFAASSLGDRPKEPEMSVIALNSVGNELEAKSIKIDVHSLELDRFAFLLDPVSSWVSHSPRVVPNFPSWMWDSWEEDPVLFVPTGVAKEILEGIHHYFNSRASSTISALAEK